MSELFAPIPRDLLGSILTSEDAVEWLAFRALASHARAGLAPDEQIARRHAASSQLLMSLWAGDLVGHVQSPSTTLWYRVPQAYWNPPDSTDMAWMLKAADVPQELPGQPRPLDPRYGINIRYYRHPLPASDLVGQAVAFRQADVERMSISDLQRVTSPLAEGTVSTRDPGRPKGTINPDGDAAVVERIIGLCDEDKGLDAAKVRRVIKSLLPEIAPHVSGTETIIRRLRGKVIRIRPDLQ